MRLAVAIAILIPHSVAHAQGALMPMDWHQRFSEERVGLRGEHARFTDVWPISRWTALKWDSTMGSQLQSLSMVRFGHTHLKISPLLTGVGISGTASRPMFEAVAGAAVDAMLGRSFAIGGSYAAGLWRPQPYISDIRDSLGVAAGYGRAFGEREFSFDQLTLCAGWQPTKHIELFIGRGKHFLGEGYRSVLLSDYAPNYNYIRTDVSVWRLKYMIINAQMNHLENYPDRFGPKSMKYMVVHNLSFEVFPWWIIGLYESVVWEHEDSVQKRGYDMQYLNPVIFFRPVEYSMGSSDNSLLGLSSALKPTKGFVLYGQILLDEFLFREYSAPFFNRLTDTLLPTGSWRNKQSYQAGIKHHEPFGWSGGTALLEVNVVRPFTYGHSNTRQSYAHMNHPLAHPLGANFVEWVGLTQWQRGRWMAGFRATYARKGFTNHIAMMGEDILVSNMQRDQNNRENGNFMLQGRLVDTGNIRMEAGYTLIEAWNLRIEAVVHHRAVRTRTATLQQSFVSLGLRTALWNDYRDL